VNFQKKTCNYYYTILIAVIMVPVPVCAWKFQIGSFLRMRSSVVLIGCWYNFDGCMVIASFQGALVPLTILCYTLFLLTPQQPHTRGYVSLYGWSHVWVCVAQYTDTHVRWLVLFFLSVPIDHHDPPPDCRIPSRPSHLVPDWLIFGCASDNFCDAFLLWSCLNYAI